MANQDITVRIRTEYQAALKDVQQFTGTASKEFAVLPRIVQQIAASLEGVNSKLDTLSRNTGVDNLQRDFATLPPIVQRLTTSIDSLSGKIDHLGAGLNRNLDDANRKATLLERTFKGIGVAASAAAGVVAAKMVVDPHINRMTDYDTRLRDLANVAYADRSPAERMARLGSLNQTITDAWRYGGGTRDQALDAYNKVIGSGAVSDDDAKAMLPTIMMGSTAASANADLIGSIGVRAVQSFGFSAKDLPRVIDMSIYSGNKGGFELKDMAEWLPSQMAEASGLGMRGESDFARLLAFNQAAAMTAGNTKEAGNNVLNLLGKINAPDTRNDFKKLGINLQGSLDAAAQRGVDPVTAFVGLVDNVMRRDKNYVALEEARGSAKTEVERKELLEKQLKLMEGGVIGNVLQDRQARLAFLGINQARTAKENGLNDQIAGTLSNSAGTMQGNFDVKAAGAGFKQQMSQNELLNAQNEALQKLNPALNALWDGTSKVAREYPALATAIAGGQIAVTALGAGMGAASISMALLTRNAGAAATALGGVAGAGGIPGAPSGSGMGRFGKLLSLTTAGSVGWGIGTMLNDYVINPGVKWATGGKSESLGGWIYDVTHDTPSAVKKQIDTPVSQEQMKGVIQGGFDSQLKGSLEVRVSVDENGRLMPRVESLRSTPNFDVSTGPMMTH